MWWGRGVSHTPYLQSSLLRFRVRSGPSLTSLPLGRRDLVFNGRLPISPRALLYRGVKGRPTYLPDGRTLP